MLSSTIKTLMGGTAAFSIPVGKEGRSVFLDGFFEGRGEETLGGGVEVRGMGTKLSLGAGGVGSGGAAGGRFDFSEALE